MRFPGIDRRVMDALERAGAWLHRENRHYVFKFPSGKLVTISKSSSDDHAVRNQLADVRKASR